MSWSEETQPRRLHASGTRLQIKPDFGLFMATSTSIGHLLRTMLTMARILLLEWTLRMPMYAQISLCFPNHPPLTTIATSPSLIGSCFAGPVSFMTNQFISRNTISKPSSLPQMRPQHLPLPLSVNHPQTEKPLLSLLPPLLPQPPLPSTSPPQMLQARLTTMHPSTHQEDGNPQYFSLNSPIPSKKLRKTRSPMAIHTSWMNVIPTGWRKITSRLKAKGHLLESRLLQTGEAPKLEGRSLNRLLLPSSLRTSSN